MKRLIYVFAISFICNLAMAQDLNNASIADKTVTDSSHFYYKAQSSVNGWRIYKARDERYGKYFQPYYEGDFDHIWLLSPHDAIIKYSGRYALFNLDTKLFTTGFDYLDVRFAWGAQETVPVGLYSKNEKSVGWELLRLTDIDGQRTVEPVFNGIIDSLFFRSNSIVLFKDGKEGVMSTQADVLIPFKYAKLGSSIDTPDEVSLIEVYNESGRAGLARIDWRGTIDELIPCEYDGVNLRSWPGVLLQGEKKAIVYDGKGNHTDFIFDSVKNYPQGSIVRIGDKYGFQKGSKLSLQVEYDMVKLITSHQIKGKKVVLARKDDDVYTYDTDGKLLLFEPTEIVEPVVDLGLSVKWASFNLGATKPEEYGDYYAWGEVRTKNEYTWSTYKWCQVTKDNLTKYNYNRLFGFADGIVVLRPEDDAAHVMLGWHWRMPTYAEWNELINQCTWTLTTKRGVDGFTVTGPNGNSIFLPSAGLIEADGHQNGNSLYYWSSSLSADSPCFARALLHAFSLDKARCGNFDRYSGFSIRPVYE